MSQNVLWIDGDGRVIYGWDTCCNGYYWSHLDDFEDLISCKDGLTLTELILDLKELFCFDVDTCEMVHQWKSARSVTPLQLRVQEMFNVDKNNLLRVVEDLQVNYFNYFQAS